MKTVTVIRVTSLSYTGTTWVNVLLGSHDRAFMLGPPDRVLGLLESGGPAGEACRIHAEECSFWPAFFEQYDPKQSFYLQLARFADRPYIVINNPTAGGPGERELAHPAVTVRPMHIVRDGRATVASYLRYYPEEDFLTALRNWFLPSAQALHFDPSDEDILCARYEDAIRDQRAFLDRAGAFIGLEYSDASMRYWEFDHHATVGNSGTLAFVRRFQGQPFLGDEAERREREYQRLIARPEQAYRDERWKDTFGRRERLAFDWFAGAVNERWGYARDRFTADELRDYAAQVAAGPEVGAPEPAPPPPPRPTPTPVNAMGRLLRSRRRLLAAAALTWIVSLVLVALGAAIAF